MYFRQINNLTRVQFYPISFVVRQNFIIEPNGSIRSAFFCKIINSYKLQSITPYNLRRETAKPGKSARDCKKNSKRS